MVIVMGCLPEYIKQESMWKKEKQNNLSKSVNTVTSESTNDGVLSYEIPQNASGSLGSVL